MGMDCVILMCHFLAHVLLVQQLTSTAADQAGKWTFLLRLLWQAPTQTNLLPGKVASLSLIGLVFLYVRMCTYETKPIITQMFSAKDQGDTQ